MRPHATKRNKKRDKLGDKLGDKMGDKLGDKLGDKPGDKLRQGEQGDSGRQGETRLREGGRTIQQRETRRGTMGGQTPGKADTPSNKGKH